MEDIKAKNQQSSRKIYCNCCGRVLGTLGREREEAIRTAKVWGYFSDSGEVEQSFHLCKECYDAFVAKFKIPVEEFPIDDEPLYTEEQLRVLNQAYAEELSK